MGHNHLKNSEASRYISHHKGRDKYGTNPIYSWMLFQPDTNKFPEGDKEWKLPHIDRPQQSRIVKSSASQHWNIPSTYGPGKKKPPIYKARQIRRGSWGRQIFLPRHRNIEDSWYMHNHNTFQSQEKGLQWSHWRFTTQVNQRNLYVTFMYDYDRNAILVEPIKNWWAATTRNEFLKIHNILKVIGRNPQVYITDNGCSSNLKEAMKNYEIDFQLAPPHMHRRNAE